MDPLIVEPSGGEIYDAGAVWLRVLAQAPDHPVSLTESIVPPGFPGAVHHRHAHMTDIFYVLEGELTFAVGDAWHVLGPGGFVLVPPGVPHTFANRSSVPARVLNIQQPAGLEQYLKEAIARMASGHSWSPAEMAEIAAHYDFEPLLEDS